MPFGEASEDGWFASYGERVVSMADKTDKNAHNSEDKSGGFSPLFNELEGVVDDVFSFDSLVVTEEEKKEDLFSDKDDGVGGLFSQTDTLSGCLDAVLANTPEDVDISLDIPAASADSDKAPGPILADGDIFESFSLGDNTESSLFDLDGQELTVVDDDMDLKSADVDVLDGSMMSSEGAKENENNASATPNKILEAVRVAESSLGENLSSDRTLQCNVSALELLGTLSDDDDDDKIKPASDASPDEISAAVRNALGIKPSSEKEESADAETKSAVPYEESLQKLGVSAEGANETMKVSLDDLVKATREDDDKQKDDEIAGDETRVADCLPESADAEGEADKTVVADTLSEEAVKKAAEDAEDKADDVKTDVSPCIEESDGDDADKTDDGPVVQLSERARMGQFYPTEEVKEADTEVKQMVEYSEELCEAVEDPEIHAQAVKRSMVRVIVGLGILCILGVVGLVSYELLTRQADAYVTAQKYGFASQSVHWLAFSASHDGRWVAVCNDGRGAVYRDGHYVSSFFPQQGCQAIQISDNGATVSYVGRNGHLSKFTLANDFGFVENSVGVFEGLTGNVYTMHPSSLSYVKADAKGLSLVHSSKGDSEALPAGAVVCFGSTGDRLAYLSGLELNIIRAGQPKMTVSLDDAKLACPQELAIACAYDGEDGWSAVCRDAYVIGRGISVKARDQYHFESVFAGVDDMSIQRHADGVEIVLPQKWISIGESGERKEVELSRHLKMPMLFVRRDNPLDPLIGMDGGKLAYISTSGLVTEAAEADPRLVAAGFINDSKKVVGVWNDQILDENDIAQGSYLVSWNLDTASLENQISIDGRVLGLNISKSGRMGYVMAQKSPFKLTWINWEKFEKLGELDLEAEIHDSVWSPDSQRAILLFEDGTTGVWEKRDNAMENVVPVSSDIALAFHSNDYVWELNYKEIENPRVRLMRLKDGLYGVDFDKIENVLRNQSVKHVTTNQYSRYVLFWGEAGIWRYDTQGDVIAQIVNEPITWLNLSNGGNLAATNLGIVDLASKDIRRSIYPNNSEPLLWSGDDKYLETQDGVMFYALDGRKNFVLNSRALDSVRFIGEGAGINQNALRSVSVRDDVATIEDINIDNTTLLAALSGFEADNWCWMSPDGKAQGKNNLCRPLKKYEVEQEMPPVEATNEAVLASTSFVANVDAVLRNPVPAVNFVDSVKLHVQAVPADAQVLFGVSEGERPAELIPTEGVFFDLPFETTIKTSDRGFAATFYKPGYAMRTVSFDARTAEKTLKTILLNEAYADITVIRHGSDEPLSEDTAIAVASFVGDNREALSACLEPSDGTRFLMVEVNEKCRIEIADGMAPDECLTAAFENAVQPENCDAAFGLEDSAFEKFDIIFP